MNETANKAIEVRTERMDDIPLSTFRALNRAFTHFPYTSSKTQGGTRDVEVYAHYCIPWRSVQWRKW